MSTQPLLKPSPLGSKFLAGYAFVVAGLAPAGLAFVGLCYGVGWHLVANILLALAIMYFAVRVFLGDLPAVKYFAGLVIFYYAALAATNLWLMYQPHEEVRSAQLAVTRVLRGCLFGGIYVWYYLMRPETAAGFAPRPKLRSRPEMEPLDDEN